MKVQYNHNTLKAIASITITIVCALILLFCILLSSCNTIQKDKSNVVVELYNDVRVSKHSIGGMTYHIYTYEQKYTTPFVVNYSLDSLNYLLLTKQLKKSDE